MHLLVCCYCYILPSLPSRFLAKESSVLLVKLMNLSPPESYIVFLPRYFWHFCYKCAIANKEQWMLKDWQFWSPHQFGNAARWRQFLCFFTVPFRVSFPCSDLVPYDISCFWHRIWQNTLSELYLVIIVRADSKPSNSTLLPLL